MNRSNDLPKWAEAMKARCTPHTEREDLLFNIGVKCALDRLRETEKQENWDTSGQTELQEAANVQYLEGRASVRMEVLGE